MGLWGVLPFENDKACDRLSLFLNANWNGIYGMLMMGFESKNDDTVLMSAAITDLILNGKDKTILGQDYRDTFTHRILADIEMKSGNEDDIEKLRKESYSAICRLIYCGNDGSWSDSDWKAHLEILERLKFKLDKYDFEERQSMLNQLEDRK